MPNFKTHLLTGAVVGSIAGHWLDFTHQNKKLEDGEQETLKLIEPLGFSIWGAIVGAIGGILPDQLEPATSSRHRKFFHSIFFGTTVAFGLYKVYQSNLPKEVRIKVLVAGIGYLSHLLLDYSTSAGLPSS